jgi:hypothetical protein
LKTDVNVPLKSTVINKKLWNEKNLFFSWHLVRKKAGSGSGAGSETGYLHKSVLRIRGSGSVPYQNVTDPQHWGISTKKARQRERKSEKLWQEGKHLKNIYHEIP